MSLNDLPSIKAALARMHPAARDACGTLATHLYEHPEEYDKEEGVDKAVFNACLWSLIDRGLDPSKGDEFLVGVEFFEAHKERVLQVSEAIVLLAVRNDEKRRKWGALGVAAGLLGVGALIGSLFG